MWPISAIRRRREIRRNRECLTELVSQASASGFHNFTTVLKSGERCDLVDLLKDLKNQGKNYIFDFYATTDAATLPEGYFPSPFARVQNPLYKNFLRKIIKIKRELGVHPATYDERLVEWEDTPIEEWERRNKENNGQCPSCTGMGYRYTYVNPDTQDGPTEPCGTCGGGGGIDAKQLRDISCPEYPVRNFTQSYTPPGLYDFYDFDFRVTDKSINPYAYSDLAKEHKDKIMQQFQERIRQDDLMTPPQEYALLYVRINPK